MTVECPLCTTDFDAEGCQSGCPFSRGCSMTRCPCCGHEFIGVRRLAAAFPKRWLATALRKLEES